MWFPQDAVKNRVQPPPPPRTERWISAPDKEKSPESSGGGSMHEKSLLYAQCFLYLFLILSLEVSSILSPWFFKSLLGSLEHHQESSTLKNQFIGALSLPSSSGYYLLHWSATLLEVL